MARPFRTACSSLLALMLVGGLAPGTAGSHPDRSRDPAADIGWKAHLARAVRGQGDGGSLAAALRGAVESLAGISLPRPEPGAEEQDAEWDDAWIETIPAGDLDGDGLEDALEYVFLERWLGGWDFSFEQRTSAVRTTDGETLWERTRADEWSFLVPAGDLDGTPGDDLLAFTIAEETVPATYLWLVEVAGVRGFDGAELWSRTYPNPFTDAGAGPTWAAADVDFAIPLGLAADADGDGVADLLVGRYSFAGLWDWASGTSAVSTGTVFELVSGRTGAPISASASLNGGWVDAAVLPDADGDGLDDVAVLEQPFDGTAATVSARSGRSGRGLWSASAEVPEDSWTFIETAEMSGDGLGDVLVRSFTFVGDEEDLFFFFFDFFGPQHVRAVSGADGAELWATILPALTSIVEAGDASGDGGSDLLVLPRNDPWAPPGGVSAAAFPRFMMTSGADGTTIWGKKPKRFGRADPAGDLNGDGVTDVLAAVRDPKGRQRIRAFSGAGGGLMWDRSRPARTAVRPLGGDLNGNGRDDLLDLRRGGRDGLRARIGRTGRAMWSGWRFPEHRWPSGISVAERTTGGTGILVESGEGLGRVGTTGRTAAGKKIWSRTTEL